MQNLLWKSAVLLAVIGGSCYVVWQAHHGIQASSSHEDVEEFVAIQSAEDSSGEAEISDSASDSPLGMQLEPLPGFAAHNAESDQPEPEPTLAPPQRDSDDKPIRFASMEKETSEPQANPFAFTSANSAEDEKLEPKPATAELPDQKSEQPANPFATQTFFPAGQPKQESGSQSSDELVIPIASDTSDASKSVLPENNPFLPLAINREVPKQAEQPETPQSLFPEPEKLPAQPEPTIAESAPKSVSFGPSTGTLSPTKAPSLMAPGPAAERSRVQTADATTTSPDSGIRQVSGEFPLLPESEARTAEAPSSEPVLPFAPSQPDTEESSEPLLPAFAPRSPRQPEPTREQPDVADNPFAQFRSSIPQETDPTPTASPFAPSPAAQPEPEAPSGITTFTPAPSSTIPTRQPESTIPELARPEPFAPSQPLDSEPAPWGAGSSIPATAEPIEPQELLPLPPGGPIEREPTVEMKSSIPEPGPITPAFQESSSDSEPVEPENMFPRITPAGGTQLQPVGSTIPKSTPPEALPEIYPAGQTPATSIPRSSIPSQPKPVPTQLNSSIPSQPSSIPKQPSTIPSQPSSIPSSIPSGNNGILPTFELNPTDSNRMVNNGLSGEGTSDPEVPTGPQAPKIKIEKIAPPEATIGEPLVYSIVIRNIGGSDAHNVVVEDRIPRGTRLDGTIPQAVLSGDKLIWELGKLPPNAEETIQLKVVPNEPGEIGSVATVSFGASVSATIRVTAPDLSLTVEAPEEALVGESVTYDFTIKNDGQGDAKKVFLRAILPAGLKHPGGNDLEYEVGDIQAGQTRNVRLNVVPTEIGIVTPQAMVTIDSKSHSDVKSDLRIIDSRLQVNRKGPDKRFVNRAAKYTNTVTNQSIEPLKNVVLTEAIPRGVDVVSSAHNGQWDPSRRIITWSIPSLQPGESRDLSCELKPNLPGAHQGKVIALDGRGKQVEMVTALDVKGFADLHADVARDLTPVSVGEQVSMRMSVVNSGNASAKGVQTAFQIPRELDFVTAQGPVKHHYDPANHTVTFAALDEVPADERKSYDYNIVLTAAQACEADVKVQLLSNDEEQQFKKRVTVLGNAETASPGPFNFTR